MNVSFNFNPKWDYVEEYFICLAVASVVFSFVIISAVHGRSTEQNQKQDKKLVRQKTSSDYEQDFDEPTSFIGKLCYDTNQNASSCNRVRFGAIKYMIVPLQLLSEFITIFFMIQLWREDRHRLYEYDANLVDNGSTDENYINNFASPDDWYHVVPVSVVLYLIITSIIILNQTLDLTEAFFQLMGIRGIILMYRQAFDNEYSQHMMDFAVLQALMFSTWNLVIVTAYAFEAFQGASQGSWYCIIYLSMFISAVNLARAMNYRDKFGLKHDTCFANTMLIAFRCAEVYLRVTVLAVFATYFNKIVTYFLIFVFIGCYFITMLNRAEFFRKENSGAQSQHKCRTFCGIFYEAVGNYFFLDVRCCISSWAFYSNFAQFVEMGLMVGVLLYKNYHPFSVFEKPHREIDLRLFFLLRIGLGLTLVLLTGLYLYCFGNYSVDQYDKCDKANVTVLLSQFGDGKSYAMDALKELILRKEIYQLRDEEARIIFQHWGGRGIKEKWQAGEFTMGEIIRLRYPLEEVSKKIPWDHIKKTAVKKLKQSITEGEHDSSRTDDKSEDDDANYSGDSPEYCCCCCKCKLDDAPHKLRRERQFDPYEKEPPAVELTTSVETTTTVELSKPDRRKHHFKPMDFLELEGAVQDADQEWYIPLHQLPHSSVKEKDKISNYYYTFVSEILRQSLNDEERLGLKHKYDDEKMHNLVEELLRSPPSPEVCIFQDANIEKLLRRLLRDLRIMIFMWRIKPQAAFTNQDIEEIQEYKPERSAEFPFFDLAMDTCLCQEDQASWEKTDEKKINDFIKDEDNHHKVFHVLEKYETLSVRSNKSDKDAYMPGFYVYPDTRLPKNRMCPEVDVVEGLTEEEFEKLVEQLCSGHLNDRKSLDDRRSNKSCADCFRMSSRRNEELEESQSFFACEGCVNFFTNCYSHLDSVGVKAFKKDDLVIVQVPENDHFREDLPLHLKHTLELFRDAREIHSDEFTLKERATRDEADAYLIELYGDSQIVHEELYFTKIREQTIVEVLFKDDTRHDSEIVFFKLINQEDKSRNQDENATSIDVGNSNYQEEYVRLDYNSLRYLTAKDIDDPEIMDLKVTEQVKDLREKHPNIIVRLNDDEIPDREAIKPDNMDSREWFQFGEKYRDHKVRVYTSKPGFAGVRGSSVWKVKLNSETTLVPESWLRGSWGNDKENVVDIHLEWQTRKDFEEGKFTLGIDINDKGKVTHVYPTLYSVAQHIREHDLQKLQDRMEKKKKRKKGLKSFIQDKQEPSEKDSKDDLLKKIGSLSQLNAFENEPFENVNVIEEDIEPEDAEIELKQIELDLLKMKDNIDHMKKFAQKYEVENEEERTQGKIKGVEVGWRIVGIINKKGRCVKFVSAQKQVQSEELTTTSSDYFIVENDALSCVGGDAEFMQRVWDGEEKDILDITEGFRIVFYKADLGFDIDLYDWTVTDVTKNLRDLEKGFTLQSMYLVEHDGNEKMEKKRTSSRDEFGISLKEDVSSGKRRDVKSFGEQEDIVNFLKGPEGDDFQNYESVKAYFLAPEQPSCCNRIKGWIGNAIFWLLGCTPSAYFSYRWFCCRGGYKVTAQNIISGKQRNGKKFIVEDGDILLESYASSGWLSLSQGGQWGHCGIIWRYKEKMVKLMPERFQNQLNAWKRRGFVKENTPLVFEMCNHIREGDTNDFKVHLSHLANWHMRKSIARSFGTMLGIRKYEGKRDIKFYKAFLELMHRHHMKDYESVPFEFVCSGLCCYATSEINTQLEYLFCSELVAALHKNLTDEYDRNLIASYAFPSEFQPSDYGALKGPVPFGFWCCCCLSYFIFGCCDARQTAHYPIHRKLGPLMICDISSIQKLEDDINADFQKAKLQEKFDDSGKTILNFGSERKRGSNSVYRKATSNIFGRKAGGFHNSSQADLLSLKSGEAVKMTRMNAVSNKERGCGKTAVEFTWWIFYIVTFPFGILIRNNYVYQVDEDIDELEETSRVLQQGKEEMTKRMRQYYVAVTGIVYLFIWFFIARWIFGWIFRLYDLVYVAYFAGIIFVGLEGSFFSSDRHKELYVTLYRTGFRFYGVRIRALPLEDWNISEILSPVKIPFMTVFMLSISFIVGLIVNSLGFKADSGKIELRLHDDPLIFIGSICGLVALVYKVGQFIIQSAVGEYPQILLELEPRTAYKRHEIENEIAEFISAKEQNNERRRLLQLEDTETPLRDELHRKINHKLHAIEKQNELWDKSLQKTHQALKDRGFWTEHPEFYFLRPLLRRERMRLHDDINKNHYQKSTMVTMKRNMLSGSVKYESPFHQLHKLTYPYGQSIAMTNICCLVREVKPMKNYEDGLQYLQMKVYDQTWGQEKGTKDFIVNFYSDYDVIEGALQYFQDDFGEHRFHPVVIFEDASVHNVTKDQEPIISATTMRYSNDIYGNDELEKIWIDNLEMYQMETSPNEPSPFTIQRLDSESNPHISDFAE